MRGRLANLLKDTIFWFLANLACGGTALGVAYALTEYTVGAGGMTLASALVLAGLVSLTWGSWIALTWTRSVPLRIAQKGVTLVPGLLLLGTGALGIYIGVGATLTWIAVLASALGTLAVTTLLWQRLGQVRAERSIASLGAGLFVYPALTAATSSLVGWLWMWFVTNPPDADWRNLLTVATLAVTILAIELATTVLPAIYSLLASETVAALRQRR